MSSARMQSLGVSSGCRSFTCAWARRASDNFLMVMQDLDRVLFYSDISVILSVCEGRVPRLLGPASVRHDFDIELELALPPHNMCLAGLSCFLRLKGELGLSSRSVIMTLTAHRLSKAAAGLYA